MGIVRAYPKARPMRNLGTNYRYPHAAVLLTSYFLARRYRVPHPFSTTELRFGIMLFSAGTNVPHDAPYPAMR